MTTTAMFGFIAEKQRDRRNKRVMQLLIVSGILHAIALVVVLILDQLRVAVVAEPTIAITFVDFASLPPPPPPPPPPKKKSTPKKVEPKVVPVEPQELVAPKEIPQKEEEPVKEDEGSDDGVEGGVEGGVAGGVIGGMGDMKPPPKVEAPPQPAQLDQATVRRRRIKGTDPEYPRQAESRQIEATLLAKITIGPDGRVKELIFLQSHPLFERSVRSAVEGWVFTPHVVNGKPVPVVTQYKFVFRLQ